MTDHNSNKPFRYLYIDGASFLKSFEDYLYKITDGDTRCFSIDWELVAKGYDRVFYYQALPKDKEKRISVETLHSKLNTIENFHVREGLTQQIERKGQKQKGVDILLAVDCLKAVLNRNVDQVDVITSDLDFYPLLNALTETRVKSHLIYDINATNSQLPKSADKATPLSARQILKWCNSIFPIKEYLPEEASHPDAKLILARQNLKQNAVNDFQASLTIDGEPYSVFYDKASAYYYISKDHTSFCVRSKSYYAALESAELSHSGSGLVSNTISIEVTLDVTNLPTSIDTLNIHYHDGNNPSIQKSIKRDGTGHFILHVDSQKKLNDLKWTDFKLSSGSRKPKPKYKFKSLVQSGFRRYTAVFV